MPTTQPVLPSLPEIERLLHSLENRCFGFAQEPGSQSAEVRLLLARKNLMAAIESLSRAPAEPVAEIFDTFGNSQDPTKCVGHVWLKVGYFPPRGTKLYAHPTESAGPAAAQPIAEGLLQSACARMLANANWSVAGALSPASKRKDFPSNGWASVKLRDLASVRDTLSAASGDSTESAGPAPADYSEQLTKAKNLLVRLWDCHPSTRPMIEGATGSWFVWGTNRDAALGESHG